MATIIKGCLIVKYASPLIACSVISTMYLSSVAHAQRNFDKDIYADPLPTFSASYDYSSIVPAAKPSLPVTAESSPGR